MYIRLFWGGRSLASWLVETGHSLWEKLPSFEALQPWGGLDGLRLRFFFLPPHPPDHVGSQTAFGKQCLLRANLEQSIFQDGEGAPLKLEPRVQQRQKLMYRDKFTDLFHTPLYFLPFSLST